MNRRNSGFTLIELLIVVAIIGILAAVGLPMFQGYIDDVRVKTTIENHDRIKGFILAIFTRCAGGSQQVALPGYQSVKCQDDAKDVAITLLPYLNSQFKNPYGNGVPTVTLGVKNIENGETNLRWGRCRSACNSLAMNTAIRTNSETGYPEYWDSSILIKE